MNSESDSNRNAAGEKTGTGSPRAREPVLLYKDSGIQEHRGTIPPWLMAVTVALLVWGVYYLIAFWTPTD